MDVYWESIGGKPDTPKGPGRKRNLSTPASDSANTKKRRQTGGGINTPIHNKMHEISSWKPPADLASWDNMVAEVETVEKTDTGVVLVYLHWYLPPYVLG